MPGEESGAGRVIAPDLYRANGSLPMVRSYHARGCGLNRVRALLNRLPSTAGFAKSEDGRWIAAVLWKSIQQFADFLLVTCHVVIAGTFMLLNFDA